MEPVVPWGPDSLAEQAAEVGLYDEAGIVPLAEILADDAVDLPLTVEDAVACRQDAARGHLVAFLPGGRWAAVTEAFPDGSDLTRRRLPPEATEPLVPVWPRKLILLAGNYVDHVVEQGYMATERRETFPYLFLKPASTTLIPDRVGFPIPADSPAALDYEAELGIVIGQGGRNIDEKDALAHVAGYTVVNDLSDRKYRPHPDRRTRERDKFFDWQHGKWHDRSCPCGPCVTSAAAIPDPQGLSIRLTVDGETRQDGKTEQMIFPVAAIVAFISRLMTLEPGDVISTGTPAGVGNATGRYLQPGQTVRATIAGIGTLTTPILPPASS